MKKVIMLVMLIASWGFSYTLQGIDANCTARYTLNDNDVNSRIIATVGTNGTYEANDSNVMQYIQTITAIPNGAYNDIQSAIDEIATNPNITAYRRGKVLLSEGDYDDYTATATAGVGFIQLKKYIDIVAEQRNSVLIKGSNDLTAATDFIQMPINSFASDISHPNTIPTNRLKNLTIKGVHCAGVLHFGGKSQIYTGAERVLEAEWCKFISAKDSVLMYTQYDPNCIVRLYNCDTTDEWDGITIGASSGVVGSRCDLFNTSINITGLYPSFNRAVQVGPNCIVNIKNCNISSECLTNDSESVGIMVYGINSYTNIYNSTIHDIKAVNDAQAFGLLVANDTYPVVNMYSTTFSNVEGYDVNNVIGGTVNADSLSVITTTVGTVGTIPSSSYSGNETPIPIFESDTYPTQLVSDTGKVDGAIRFNGSDSYINTSDTFQTEIRGNSTWYVWAKPDDGQPSTEQYILDANTSNNRLSLKLNTDGTITFDVNSNGNKASVTSGIVFSNGEATDFKLITVTVKQTDSTHASVAIFIDGILSSLTTNQRCTLSEYTSDNAVKIGSNYSGSTGFYDGVLDDFRTYDRNLQSIEVKALYNYANGLPIPSTKWLGSGGWLHRR